MESVDICLELHFQHLCLGGELLGAVITVPAPLFDDAQQRQSQNARATTMAGLVYRLLADKPPASPRQERGKQVAIC